MKLSIITVNLNNAIGLKRTIESVISQTFTDYEYIIIDGGSTDGSVDIIKQNTDKIAYWVSEPDKGIYNAMNKGILKAQGEYLIFMNSGDCFVFDVLMQIQEQLTADIVCGNVEKKRIIGSKKLKSVSEDELSMMSFYKTTPFPHQACFLRKILFKDDLYNEENRIFSDWEFAVKKTIFQNCSYKKLNAKIADMEPYGISDNMSSKDEEERSELLERIFSQRILKDYEFYSYRIVRTTMRMLRRIIRVVKLFSNRYKN